MSKFKLPDGMFSKSAQKEMEKHVKAIQDTITKHLEPERNVTELLCAAFISETGLKPSECEIVSRQEGATRIISIRKRDD